jgi:hypothetical protein
VVVKLIARIALSMSALALVAAPAFAIDNPGSGHSSGTPGASHVPGTVPPSGTTGAQHAPSSVPPSNPGQGPQGGPPSDVPPSQAKALGKTECQKLKTNFGDNRSAFGKCIAAVAQGLQTSDPTKATFERACRNAGLSHKKAKGKKRSPFSACVEAGAKALGS